METAEGLLCLHNALRGINVTNLLWAREMGIMPLMTVLKSTNVCMLIFLARKFMLFFKLMLTEIPPSIALSNLHIFMTLNFYNNLLIPLLCQFCR